MAGNNTVAAPVISLGLNAGGLQAGINEALATMRGAAAAIAAVSAQIASKPIELGVNSTKMLADLAGLTDSVDSALKAFGRLQSMSDKAARSAASSAAKSADVVVSQSSIDMMAKLNGTYSPTAAMGRSTPTAAGGPDPFLAVTQKWREDAVKVLEAEADALAQRMKDWVTKPTSKLPGGVEAALDALVQDSITASKIPSKVQWLKAHAGALAKWSGGGILSGAMAIPGAIGRAPSGALEALTKFSMPLNQTLELAAKVNRVLGAPIRSAMVREGGDADVVAGGNRLLGSGTLSGTMARFERQVDEMFADIWRFVDQTFDLQTLFEGVRGAMAGVSALIQAALGPIENITKDPKALEAAFKAGANILIDAFESVAKTAIEIRNGWAEVINWIRKIPGLGLGYSDEQEALIKAEQEKNLQGMSPAEKVAARQRHLDGIFVEGHFGKGKEDQWKLKDSSKEILSREDVIKSLVNKNLLPDLQISKMGTDRIDEVVAGARKNIEKMAFNPGIGAGAQDAANKALEAFTRSLVATTDPLAGLTSAYQQNLKQIVDSSANAQIRAAATAAAGADFGAKLAALAQPMIEQERASFSPGGALDTGSMQFAEAVIRASNQGRAGSGDMAGQQLRALEQIRLQTERTAQINQKLLEAWQNNVPPAPVHIGVIGGL